LLFFAPRHESERAEPAKQQRMDVGLRDGSTAGPRANSTTLSRPLLLSAAGSPFIGLPRVSGHEAARQLRCNAG
jgi:hypothetical protein